MDVLHNNEQLFFQLALALVCGGLLGMVGPQQRWKAIVTVVAAVLTYGFALPAVLAMALLVFWIGHAARGADGAKRDKSVRWRLSLVAIAMVCVLFAAFRMSPIGSLPHGLMTRWQVLVLDMWMALRLVTFLYDVGSGRITSATLTSYLGWVFLPFQAFGPLLRFGMYATQERNATPPVVAREATTKTALLGAAQIAGAVAIGVGQSYFGTLVSARTAQVMSLGFSAPWTFYLLMAGYFKVMEVAALGWGLTLPPSFRNPFAKRNLSAFWSSWNMTATAAFRDAIFFQRWKSPAIDPFINTCIVFLLVGAWHGTNAYWLIWGALHATGFSLYLWISRRWRNAAASPSRALAFAEWGVTYLFVVFCWAAPPQIIKLGHQLF